MISPLDIVLDKKNVSISLEKSEDKANY